MTETTAAPARLAPTATQAVTVVQPSEPAMMINVGQIGTWCGSIAAIVGLMVLIYKFLTREISRDIADVRRDVDAHGRDIEKLKTDRIEDAARLVKAEAAVANIENLLNRIDRNLNDRFDQLAESIREVRSVRPRS